jgi:DNA repair exonuclease SbcCD ATPase subunit
MNKINSIQIAGIRGIRDSIQLDLNRKPVLCYGDNGTGKSSITDAFEWFFYDRIEHLSSEEVAASKGKGALRNLFLSSSALASVKIDFAQKDLNNAKSINGSLRIADSNKDDNYKSYIEATQSENLILRYRDLVTFIVATKKEKLDTLQKIIGFKEVGEIRDLLRKNAGRIARNIKAANYENKKSNQQAILLENFGQNITSAKQFYEVANKLIEPLKLKIKIEDYRTIQEVLKEIEEKEDTETIEKISFLNKVSETLFEVLGNVESIEDEYNDFYNSFNKLKNEKQKIDGLQLLILLLEARKLFLNELIREDYCPLCKQAKNRLELLQEINSRIEEFETLSQEKERIEQSAKELQQKLLMNLNQLNNLISDKQIQKQENKELNDKTTSFKSALEAYRQETEKNLISQELRKPQELTLSKVDAEETANIAKTQAAKLLESHKKNPRLQIHTRLSLATQAYLQYGKIVIEENVLRKQQRTFEALYADFIRRQESAINTFLEMFSNEINDYYTTMNPGEKVENIRLIPLKDSNDDLVGITMEYNFFDKTKSPPIAYLSESHLNCLGLAFFLASVKAFNKQNHFFILDDIISSYDRAHRTRFIRLLTDKFNDYQIILLTHEREFFELIAAEVRTKGWLLHDIHWTDEYGTTLRLPMIDYKAHIEEKFRNRDINDLGNLIRKYLERQLKSVALELEAKVAYKNNDSNEKRVASELLDSLQNKVSKASPELKESADIPKIKGIPLLLGNVASHDNPFQESVEDLEVVWEDIKDLLHKFYCNECSKFISLSFYDSVEKKIRCGCAKLKYNWKR